MGLLAKPKVHRIISRVASIATWVGALGVFLTVGYFLNVRTVEPGTGQHYDALGQPMHRTPFPTGPHDDGWRSGIAGETKKLLLMVAYSLPWAAIAVAGYCGHERLKRKASMPGKTCRQEECRK